MQSLPGIFQGANRLGTEETNLCLFDSLPACIDTNGSQRKVKKGTHVTSLDVEEEVHLRKKNFDYKLRCIAANWLKRLDDNALLIVLLRDDGSIYHITEVEREQRAGFQIPRYCRSVVDMALSRHADQVIVVQSQQSKGALEPSHCDKRTTRKLKKALEVVGVHLKDRVIMKGRRTFSFSDKGLI